MGDSISNIINDSSRGYLLRPGIGNGTQEARSHCP